MSIVTPRIPLSDLDIGSIIATKSAYQGLLNLLRELQLDPDYKGVGDELRALMLALQIDHIL